LRSYSTEEIVEKVKRDLEFGVREFWLTSQDTACYGRDVDLSLAELVRAVCNVQGDFKVRVGMMTPNEAMRILSDLIEVFEDEKVFQFLHLPVQSGDDQILGGMRRSYSVEDFKKIVDTFRSAFPHVTLATDVICGFPNESPEAFERTLHLIKDVNPDIVNVSKFFARPSTVAAEMYNDFVPRLEIKRRSAIAAKLAKEIAFERNQRWIGWTGDVLIDEAGKFSGSWIGRNLAYKPVVVKNAKDVFGKVLQVKVVKASSTHLEAEIIE
jgi:MiaB/RimO family radical SAM methylthiotransferase